MNEVIPWFVIWLQSGSEQEILPFSPEEEAKEEIGETSFGHILPIGVHKSPPGGVSPARSSELSSPARSDTEFIKKRSFAPSPQVVKQKVRNTINTYVVHIIYFNNIT